MNKMRIICDPFKKKITYQWFNLTDRKYGDLIGNSKLLSDKFVNTTIQDRACEIIRNIKREFNPGNMGLKITFIGNVDDYLYFSEVLEKDFKHSNIICSRDKHRFFYTASEAVSHFNSKFSKIKKMLEEHNENEMEKYIEKYHEVITPKYELSHECQRASDYLKKAIVLYDKEVKKQIHILRKVEGEFGSKKKILCDRLEQQKNQIKKITRKFQEVLDKYYNSFIEYEGLHNSEMIENNLNDKWKSLKKEKEKKEDQIYNHKIEWLDLKNTLESCVYEEIEFLDGETVSRKELLQKAEIALKDISRKEEKIKQWEFSRIGQYVNKLFNNYLSDFSERANVEITEFWEQKFSEFRKNCLNIILGSRALTKEQKSILKSFALVEVEKMETHRLEFDFRREGSVGKPKILLFELPFFTFDSEKCSNQLIEQFEDVVKKRMKKVVSKNEENFRKQTDLLINTLMIDLCKFNIELSMYESKIKRIKARIKSKTECRKMLSQSSEYIDNLLGEQEHAHKILRSWKI